MIFDIDLAADATRLANRLRDALLSTSSALERAFGERWASPVPQEGMQARAC